MKLSRRRFLRLSALGGAFLVSIRNAPKAFALNGKVKLLRGGKDFSPKTKKERRAIPSACWQCVSRDAILGYVEDGRLVKIEGNPKSIKNRGLICNKGQAGINQVYDPDRLLYPMIRVGKRGEGKWKRISWEEALDLLINGGVIAGHKVKGLKTLRDEGHPENFMFHYGRLKGSDSKIVGDFLTAYGTGTIGNHTSICEGGKWTAQELCWGVHYDVNDVANTKMILNFGCNFFETHTSHIQMYQRAIDAVYNKGVKLYTFDIRLSNTAAKSTEWIPIKPATDLAVVLAMCNLIMGNDLYDRDFIETWTNVTANQLKEHLKKYTPEWAEKISGVPAGKIRSLAIEFANAKPGTCVSYRGAVAHYNGVDTERAMKMLDAICGYIDIRGGTNHGIGAKWSRPSVSGSTKKLGILDGFSGASAYPTHHVNHQVLKMIKDGKNGRPDIYLIHCYNPVYVNGECQENIDILKDEKLIPFVVSADMAMSESTALADLILPDVTYLERLSWDDMVSYEMIPEFYLRQPVVKPLGEVRQFQDVCLELAKRLGLKIPYESTLDYVQQSCKKSGVDFAYLKQHGVWHDPSAKPKYLSYAKELSADSYTGSDTLFDRNTGVYWNWKKSSAKSREEAESKGYTETKNAYKGYVGQRIGEKVFAGFKPDKINKSGRFEIHSEFLKKKGFQPMPSWIPVPEFEKKKDNELILASYKVAVQTHSRTQNCKWLSEIYHDNPALINPITAAKLGVRNGSRVKVRSQIGEIITKVVLSEGIIPGIIGISYHCGHWEYGRYASGKKSSQYALGRNSDPDLKLKWWKKNGMHPNWIIPNSPDPIAGQWRMNDTVVTVERA